MIAPLLKSTGSQCRGVVASEISCGAVLDRGLRKSLPPPVGQAMRQMRFTTAMRTVDQQRAEKTALIELGVPIALSGPAFKQPSERASREQVFTACDERGCDERGWDENAWNKRGGHQLVRGLLAVHSLTGGVAPAAQRSV